MNTWPEAEQSFTEFSKRAPANRELLAQMKTLNSDYLSLERDHEALGCKYEAEKKKGRSQKGDLDRLQTKLDRALSQNRTMQKRHDTLAEMIEEAHATLSRYVVPSSE